MSARDIGQALIERCLTAARDAQASAHDQREANVFRVAAGLIWGQFSAEALCLIRVSEHHFAQHPDHQLPAEVILHNRWVIGLPRLRDRLTFELSRQPVGFASGATGEKYRLAAELQAGWSADVCVVDAEQIVQRHLACVGSLSAADHFAVVLRFGSR